EFVDVIRPRHNASAIVKQAAEADFQGRRVYQPESSKPASTEENIVFEKFAVDDLRVRFPQVEYRSDIGKDRERRRAEDRNSVFEITEYLRIAADETIVARKDRRIRAVVAGRLADGRDLVKPHLRNICRSYRRSGLIGREAYIPRRHIGIERCDRADGSVLISAKVVLAAQIIAFVSRDTADERDRIRVPYLIGQRVRPDRAGLYPERENF